MKTRDLNRLRRESWRKKWRDRMHSGKPYPYPVTAREKTRYRYRVWERMSRELVRS